MTGLIALLGVSCSGSGGLASPPVTSRTPVPVVTDPPAPITAAPPLTAAPATTATTTVAPPVNGPQPATPVVAAGWTASPWQPAGRVVGTTPAVYSAMLHPGPATAAVGIAWLDTPRLRIALYAGNGDPAGTWPTQGSVASTLWPDLVATFNSGFKVASSGGGWYLAGRAAVPLRAGAASLVINMDGAATVGMWGRDAQLSSGVAAVRQNLGLLVDAGRPVSGLTTNIVGGWGATLGGVLATWRSGVGVDRAGHLVYAAGPGLNPATLAAALVAAGAIRAMELDINPQWPAFDIFTDGPGGVAATKLLPTMASPATHFLFPSARDFFAVFARS